MLKIYGSPMCPDCLICKDELTRAGVEFLDLDITRNLMYLKKFLALRDSQPLFEPVRAEGKIGIPCIQRVDGTVTLDWKEFM